MGQTFRSVILPLTKPIASAVVVLTLINSWKAYLLPLLFLQSPNKQTVTLLPQFFQGEFTNDQTKILAAAVLTAIPEIVAYLCMQEAGFAPVFKQEKGYEAYEYFDAAKDLGVLVELKEQY